ncbi:hypothetical protein FB451DRAFT_1265761 [Mycena latifolia]|nr:hypothetical protein FB451DRAFT_1265761 [Mycena latifolia]
MAITESLPPEIWIEIWKLTLPSREEAFALGKISLMHSPWNVARVCGRWRATMLNTPSMWSNLFISTRRWINYSIPLLKEQISRAGQHPLRVCMICKKDPLRTAGKIFAAIVHSCPRWETLELVSNWPLPTYALLHMRNNIPLLREVHICADCLRGYAGQDVLEFAPSLKVVRITDPPLLNRDIILNRQYLEGNDYTDSFVFPPAPPFETALPWAQLMHYESQCANPFLFDALCLAENLVVCQARVIVEARHAGWRVPAGIVRFMHLQKLTLTAPGPLLDRLALPALQDFFIEVPPCDFHHVVALVQRSNCSLRKFWVKSQPHPAQYRQILLANPDILELGLIGRNPWQENRIPRCPHIDNIIRGLRVDAAAVLVPRLRSFCIHDQAVDLDMQGVLDMVGGRLGAPLYNGVRDAPIFAQRRGAPDGITG